MQKHKLELYNILHDELMIHVVFSIHDILHITF